MVVPKLKSTFVAEPKPTPGPEDWVLIAEEEKHILKLSANAVKEEEFD